MASPQRACFFIGVLPSIHRHRRPVATVLLRPAPLPTALGSKPNGTFGGPPRTRPGRPRRAGPVDAQRCGDVQLRAAARGAAGRAGVAGAGALHDVAADVAEDVLLLPDLRG